MAEDEEKIAELRAIVEGIRDRVRAQYPDTSVVVDSGCLEPIRVPVADLMPILHARDAAQAKMAAIGSVNPRAGGIVNDAIQRVKRTVARGLNWFVRDQIVFNRGALACVEATMEALNDLNRSITALGAQIDARLQQDRQAVESRLLQVEARAQAAAGQAADLARKWDQARIESAKRDLAWQETFEERDQAIEGFRRSIEASRQQYEERTLALEKSYADLSQARHEEFKQLSKTQHAEFENALARSSRELQERLAQDMQRIKLEFERVIHSELRVVRQRASLLEQAPEPAAAPMQQSGVPLDYQAFSDRFRGSEEYVKENQRFYAGRFRGEVLDLGCGKGEFLEVMREGGIRARGVDDSAESVSYCRAKGLDVEQADLFAYLSDLTDASLDGILSSQVVEHLPGNRIPEMIRLCAAKLRRGGLLAIETPNPECLAIFATHFYLDPTHVRPVPSPLLAFYMEENGLGGIEVKQRFPAADSYPELNELPEGVRKRFFGGLDYVIFGSKP